MSWVDVNDMKWTEALELNLATTTIVVVCYSL